MKKLLVSFLIILMLLCAFGISACAEPEHKHSYDTLKHSMSNHWYECSCGDKISEEGHSGGTATCTQLANCSVCETPYGDLESHEHATLKYDENNHWYECACGDKLGEEEHKGGTATTTNRAVCNICGSEYGQLEIAPLEGLVFSLNDQQTEYSVTGYFGSDSKLIIPSTYENKPVTSIGSYALYNCTSLTSVYIPKSIVAIGYRAFYFCFNLTIYCEIEIKPSGWDNNWNESNCTVEWGYKPNQDSGWGGNVFPFPDEWDKPSGAGGQE